MTSPAEVESGSTVAQAAVQMGAVTAASRVIGFLRVLVIAAVLGTTYLGNTFQSSNTVSNVLFELIAAGALSAALVPGFVTRLRDGVHVARLANALCGIAVVGLGVVSIAAMVNARWIAELLVSRAPSSAVAEQQADLATFLLWFFIPQLVFYGVGAIAIAVLQAQRRFIPGAVAPVASSVVLLITMGIFRLIAGPDPGLTLTLAARLTLAFGGTLAVIAFVAIPVAAVWASGMRFYPSLHWGGTLPLLRSSLWAVVLHAGLGALLAAALVSGNAVAGGVVAFQVAWTFFLAPYAVLAQPIHTAILPELTLEANDPDAFAASVRWSLAGMARLLIPVSALLFAFARPLMEVLAFGNASGGTALLATALAWLAVGLFPYGALLLATRAFFALGDTRTPAVLTVFGSLIGACIMLMGSALVGGTAVVAIIAIGQSVGAFIAAIALLAVLHSRLGRPVTPVMIVTVCAVVLPLGALLTWFAAVTRVESRIVTAAVFGGISAVVVVLYLGLLRWVRWLRLPERGA